MIIKIRGPCVKWMVIGSLLDVFQISLMSSFIPFVEGTGGCDIRIDIFLQGDRQLSKIKRNCRYSHAQRTWGRGIRDDTGHLQLPSAGKANLNHWTGVSEDPIPLLVILP